MNDIRRERRALLYREDREQRRHSRTMVKVQKELIALQIMCPHPVEARKNHCGAFSGDGWTECTDCGASVV